MTAVKHIIYMLQENRSFDQYFGQMNAYRQNQGFSADVDVTPDNASQLSYDHSTTFTPFHMNSQCMEEMSSYWNESHNDWNHFAPTTATPLMDGFANSAGGDSRNSNPPGFDINGQRVMGYYDDGDLPYYYFMAAQFAISDRWFSPIMTNTPANRMYAVAATSHGVVNKPLTQINVPTIFDELQAAGITWRTTSRITQTAVRSRHFQYFPNTSAQILFRCPNTLPTQKMAPSPKLHSSTAIRMMD